MSYLVSVEIPIYNSEKSLKKCVDSVLNQSYTQLEILLIDDGSSDNSGAICDEYEKIDSRVRVIHKKNGGVVSARKTAAKYITGEFVAFSDSDDWMEMDYIEKLVKVQQNSGADIVTAAISFDMGVFSKKLLNDIDEGIYNPKEIIKDLIFREDFSYGIQPHLVDKLIRSNIYIPQQLVVDDCIVAGDDALVVYPCVLKSEKIAVTNTVGYHYIQRFGSITKKRTVNERLRLERLIEQMSDLLISNWIGEFDSTLINKYKNYIATIRDLGFVEEARGDMILSPWGGIQKANKIIIYGAGGCGREVYRYLKQDVNNNVTLWVDKEYLFYQRHGYPVKSPNAIFSTDDYDIILIAVTETNVAGAIYDFLVHKGIDEGKIRYLTKEYMLGI